MLDIFIADGFRVMFNANDGSILFVVLDSHGEVISKVMPSPDSGLFADVLKAANDGYRYAREVVVKSQLCKLDLES